MKTIPLRDFLREGAKALGTGSSTGPWLLTDSDQEFLLLPVTPDTRMTMLDLAEGLAAVAALRQGQARAAEAGLDQLTTDEIDEEIRAARKHRKPMA